MRAARGAYAGVIIGSLVLSNDLDHRDHACPVEVLEPRVRREEIEELFGQVACTGFEAGSLDVAALALEVLGERETLLVLEAHEHGQPVV